MQSYGADVGVHKPTWPHQPHLLPPLDTQKPLDIKHLKPEIKLEPSDTQKRPHPEAEMMVNVYYLLIYFIIIVHYKKFRKKIRSSLAISI